MLLYGNTINAQVYNDAYNLATASADLCSGKGLLFSKNPANITKSDLPKIQLNQISPYSLKAFQGNAISVIFKNARQYFAIEYAQLGKNNFKHHLYNLTSGIKLGEKTSIGTKIILHQYNRIETLKNSYFTMEIGLNQVINSKLSYGIHTVYNIKETNASDNESFIRLGISYKIAPKFDSYCSIKMNEFGILIGSIALDYNIHQNISTQIGWNTSESAICSGIQYQVKRSRIEMGSSYHPILGFSYAVGLCYRFNNNDGQ